MLVRTVCTAVCILDVAVYVQGFIHNLRGGVMFFTVTFMIFTEFTFVLCSIFVSGSF